MEARYYCFLKSIYLDSYYILEQKETEVLPLTDISFDTEVNDVIDLLVNQLKNSNKFKNISNIRNSHKIEIYLFDSIENRKVFISISKDKYGFKTDIQKYFRFNIKKFENIKLNTNYKPKEVKKQIQKEPTKYVIDYWPNWDVDKNGRYLHNDLQHEWVYAESELEARNVARSEIDDLGEIIRVRKLN